MKVWVWALITIGVGLAVLSVLYPPLRRLGASVLLMGHRAAVGHIKRQLPRLQDAERERAKAVLEAHVRASEYEYTHTTLDARTVAAKLRDLRL